jgi:DNA processing protein
MSLLAGLRLDDTPQREGSSPETTDGAAGTDGEYGQLLAAMAWDPVDADSLVARSGLTIGEVSSMLLMLEMQGSVRALSGGRYQRAGKNRRVHA